MDVQALLLAGQVLVVALVYLFVWRVVRSARGGLLGDTVTAPRRGRGKGAAPAPMSMASQESTIIPVADVQAARRSAGLADPRLVVLESDVLRAGIPFTVGGGLTIGRAAANDVVLDEGVVSGRHVRIVPPGTVVDEGSTNGTLVNGRPAQGRVALRDGDSLQVGSTVFRYEAPR
ncbi:MAG: domain containing protein [Thermoleophilia bacterium]|nr:domain containing protein [Thermoleophilia bacterium]